MRQPRGTAPVRARAHARRAVGRRLVAGLGTIAILWGAVPSGHPGPAAGSRTMDHGALSGRAVHLLGSDTTPAGTGTMAFVAHAIGADDAWKDGYTGSGIDIALIDSGVSPVQGLAGANKVINGPDLSFDLQAGHLPYEDAFGHGTHLAGIMAGADRPVDKEPAQGSFTGIAPGARVVNVKVAGRAGETDVTQVIAGIDWVVQHRADRGLHVRVLTLAFGTDGIGDYRVDPLARAVENAWEHGIVVVVAAGNGGADRIGLVDPAFDPWVIAVGAADPGTSSRVADDTVPEWSGRGDGTRNPDLVAPGVSLRSLRVPGSSLDAAVPPLAGSERFIGGSGTSQATAVVSGAVALLLDKRPDLTPDRVKAILTGTASPLPLVDPALAGAGVVNVERALSAGVPSARQSWPRSSGAGSLEASRGTSHVLLDGVPLAGEQDVMAQAWDGAAWAQASAAGTAWNGGTWNGAAWTGGCLCSTSWSGLSWSGLSWSGLSWSGLSWSGLSWSGLSWSGLSWSGQVWSGLSAERPVEGDLADGGEGWSTAGWDAG